MPPVILAPGTRESVKTSASLCAPGAASDVQDWAASTRSM